MEQNTKEIITGLILFTIIGIISWSWFGKSIERQEQEALMNRLKLEYCASTNNCYLK